MVAIVIDGHGVIGAAAVADHTNEPRGPAGSLPSPVLFEVILAGLNAATRYKDDDADKRVEDGIDEDTTGDMLVSDWL